MTACTVCERDGAIIIVRGLWLCAPCLGVQLEFDPVAMSRRAAALENPTERLRLWGLSDWLAGAREQEAEQ